MKNNERRCVIYFNRSKKFVIVSVCYFCSVFLFSALIPQPTYAQIGADVKATLKDLPYYQSMIELNEVELKEYEDRLDSLNFKFAIPSEYCDGINGTELDLSKVYLSKINLHETRDAWLSVRVEEREWHYHKYRKSFVRDSTEYTAVDDINEEALGKIAVIVSAQYI